MSQSRHAQQLPTTKPMRILYIDSHLHFINPTTTLLPNVINGVGEVTFYGPGYVADDILAQGVLKFSERTGPHDIFVVGPNMPILSFSDDNLRATVDYIAKFTALGSSKDTTYAFFVDVLKHLNDLVIPHRFASLVSFDWYSSRPEQIERLIHYDLKLITPNEHFIRPMAELPEWASDEKHYQRNAHLLSDAWYHFIAARPERVITALHFVADAEFSFRALCARRGQISIPGIDYATRRQAMAALRQKRMRIPSRIFYNLYRTLNRIGVPVYANFIT
ncbi:MAG: hypothetical protein JO237_01640, partial [Pseudolabrys sp.]|nr:hypothetical protein [Pseudolabrys sp.]